MHGAPRRGIGSATFARRTESNNRRAVGTISPDGMGRMSFTDRDVTPGTRYGHRLGVVEYGRQSFHGETWWTIPVRSELALRGLQPNPSSAHGSVVISLPDDHQALFELIDIRGRRVLDQKVGSLGAGTHALLLNTRARWPVGLHLMRLTHGARALTARGVIVRWHWQASVMTRVVPASWACAATPQPDWCAAMESNHQPTD